jgi:hypothetical protein
VGSNPTPALHSSPGAGCGVDAPPVLTYAQTGSPSGVGGEHDNCGLCESSSATLPSSTNSSLSCRGPAALPSSRTRRHSSCPSRARSTKTPPNSKSTPTFASGTSSTRMRSRRASCPKARVSLAPEGGPAEHSHKEGRGVARPDVASPQQATARRYPISSCGATSRRRGAESSRGRNEGRPPPFRKPPSANRYTRPARACPVEHSVKRLPARSTSSEAAERLRLRAAHSDRLPGLAAAALVGSGIPLVPLQRRPAPPVADTGG